MAAVLVSSCTSAAMRAGESANGVKTRTLTGPIGPLEADYRERDVHARLEEQ